MSLVRGSTLSAGLGTLAVLAQSLHGQGGLTIEHGIRFPDGTVQVTSAHAPSEVSETGLQRCYDAAGSEVICAGTGQDADLRSGMEWPQGQRFIDINSNGTVIDLLTGLMWLKDAGCIDGVSWEGALAAVGSLNSGTDFGCTEYTPMTFTDWRMPNITELATLIDYGSPDAFPEGHPFVNAGSGNCWTLSSTTQIEPDGSAERAWGTPFGTFHPSPHGLQGLIKSGSVGCLLPVRDQIIPIPPAATVLELQAGGVTFGDGSKQSSASLRGLLLTRQTGQTDCFNELGLQIQCDSSGGHDGETQNGVPWPSPRFVDKGDGTVDDQLTRLTWLKDPECLGAFLSWDQAFSNIADLASGSDFSCTGYTPGSFDDWRMPTVNELVSLFDYGSSEGLSPGHPFDFSDPEFCHTFWSSTTAAASPENAWPLRIGPDATFFDVQSVAKNGTLCAWPVREGTGS